ncbi:tyrosine-protein phosphatase [Paracidovorax avenae]|uniref:tyrosine-protein phosphatase n=1 Tax=Paracidovorax avenae TaxID=80867 RepID=UPI001CEF8F23|nr:tyrosine-protein phosphatase [Paracidovorax avenae]
MGSLVGFLPAFCVRSAPGRLAARSGGFAYGDGCGRSIYTRSINLFGATNFRDLGGCSDWGGRRVRWRCMFRLIATTHLTLKCSSTYSALRHRRDAAAGFWGGDHKLPEAARWSRHLVRWGWDHSRSHLDPVWQNTEIE